MCNILIERIKHDFEGENVGVILSGLEGTKIYGSIVFIPLTIDRFHEDFDDSVHVEIVNFLGANVVWNQGVVDKSQLGRCVEEGVVS